MNEPYELAWPIHHEATWLLETLRYHCHPLLATFVLGSVAASALLPSQQWVNTSDTALTHLAAVDT